MLHPMPPDTPPAMSGSMNAHPTGGDPAFLRLRSSRISQRRQAARTKRLVRDFSTLNSAVTHHHQSVSRGSNNPQQEARRTLAPLAVELPDPGHHHQPVSRGSNNPQQEVGRTLAPLAIELPDAG